MLLKQHDFCHKTVIWPSQKPRLRMLEQWGAEPSLRYAIDARM